MSTDAGAFEELVCDVLERVDAGEEFDREAFVAQHPEFAKELAEFFNAEDFVTRMAGPVVETDNMRAAETVAPDADLGTADTQTNAGGDSQSGHGPSDAEPAPETFGRYRLVKTLGEGAMGSVHLAEDTMLKREVALKLPKFGDDQPELQERFLVEARAAANLRHTNICPVFDVGEEDGRSYITMAYIAGRPLSDYAKTRTRQKVRQVVKVVRKLALALQVAHEAGVVHRDVKPANVMIDEQGEPVVMDFGLARHTTHEEGVRLTRSGAIMGTPAYMSPEQVEGRIDEVGPASDQFSLGAVLYEMLTGELPFPGTSMGVVMSKIMNDEPAPPSALRPEVDPLLDDITLRMMAKPIDGRFASMKEVAEALTGWLQQDKERAIAGGADPRETAPFVHPSESAPPEPTTKEQVTEPAVEPGPLVSSPELEPPPVKIAVEPEPVMDRARPKRRRPRKQASSNVPAGIRPPLPPWAWIAGGLAGAALLVVGLVFLLRTPYGTLKITVDDPRLTVVVEGDESPTITLTDGKGYDDRRRAGKHRLAVMIGETPLPLGKETTISLDGKERTVKLDVSGVTLSGDEFTIARNGETAVTIKLVATTTSSENEVDEGESSVRPRYALEFDGENDIVRIPTLVYDGSHPITLEAWVRPESANDADKYFRFILSNWTNTNETPSGLGLQQRLGADGTEWGFWVSVPCEDGLAKTARSGSWQIGRLSHVALVVDGLVYRFFVDGEIATMGRLPCAQVTNDRPFSIGGAKFHGTIEEIRVSKVAQYTDEFEPPRDLADDEGVVALYHFDEGDGEILKDSSGNGHHGAIAGAKWVPLDSDDPEPFAFPAQLVDLAVGQWQPLAANAEDLAVETNYGATLDDGVVELVAPEGRVDGRVVFEKVRGKRIILRADVERIVGHTAGLAFEGQRRDYNIHGGKNRNAFSLGYRVKEQEQESQNFEPPAPTTTSGSHDIALAVIDGHAAMYLDGKLVMHRDDCEDWAWTPMLSNFNWEDKDPAKAVYRNLRVMVLDGRATEAPKSETWTNLFDGRDLKGFEVVGTGEWSVYDGVIVADGGGRGLLRTKDEYGDCEFDMEYRLPKKGNTGIHLRVAEGETSASQGAAVEVQLMDDDSFSGADPAILTGSLHKLSPRTRLPNTTPYEWHRVRVRVEGRRVVVEQDGIPLLDSTVADDQLRDRGHIGLQMWDTAAEFRNVRVRRLGNRTNTEWTDFVNGRFRRHLVRVKAPGDNREHLAVVTDLGLCTVYPGAAKQYEISAIDGTKIGTGAVGTRNPFPFCWIDPETWPTSLARRAADGEHRREQAGTLVMKSGDDLLLREGRVTSTGTFVPEIPYRPSNRGVSAPGPIFNEEGELLGYGVRLKEGQPIKIYPAKRDGPPPKRPAASDREIAERIIGLKGGVQPVGYVRYLNTIEELPEGDFRIDGVEFRRNSDLHEEHLAVLAELPDLKSVGFNDVYSINVKGYVAFAGLPNVVENVTELSFFNSGLEREGLVALTKLRKLESLYLSGCILASDDLALLAEMPALRKLTIFVGGLYFQGVPHLTDDCLRHLENVKTLEGLELIGDRITDAGFAHLTDIESLEEVLLRTSKVSDAAIAAMRKRRPSLRITDAR